MILDESIKIVIDEIMGCYVLDVNIEIVVLENYLIVEEFIVIIVKVIM